MVKTPLVDELKLAGRDLVESLDRSGVEIRAALWLYLEDGGDWRLVIATPLADRIGSREVYRRLYPIWRAGSKLDWSQITITGVNDRMVRLVRSAFPGGHVADGSSLSRQVIEGTYIEDAFIYRMNL